MATNDPKQQAREKREQAQAAALAKQKRDRNLQILVGLVFVAILFVIGLAFLGGGEDERGAAKGESVAGITETKDLLAGVEQSGLTLGDPKAPVTIVEFLDVQCPFCRTHQLDEQPKIITNLVKTGKARLTAQIVALPQMGEDSIAGRVVALRMANKNVGWNFLNLFFFNQGDEQTGYVTDAYLKKLVAAVPKTTTGVTTTPAEAVREGDDKINASADKIEALSQDLGVSGTPSFAIGKTGQPASTYELVEMNGSESVADQLATAVEEFKG
jgi:protein-disulfide isomerase